MTERTRQAISAVLLLVTAVAIGLAIAGHASPARTVITLAFYLFVPGAAVAGLISFRDAGLEIATALGLSLGIDIVVAEIMLLSHSWEPFTAFYSMAIISAVLLLIQIGRPAFAPQAVEA